MRPQLSVWIVTLAPEDPGSWESVLDQAEAADRAGLHRVVLTGEHVVLGERLDRYGDPSVGGQPGAVHATGPDGHFLEPIVTMAMVAARTSRVRVTSGIMLAALRRPIVLAKAAATLDVLSGGRLDLGVGVGWQQEEYEAAGLDFAARGRLLDHTLEVCRALWREAVADHSSAELSFERIHAMPQPVQPGGVPIWIAGRVIPPVMRRLARFGAGWIPWGEPSGNLDALIAAIPQMRDAVARFDRDPANVQVAATLPVSADGPAATMDSVPDLTGAGVSDFRLAMALPADLAAAEDLLAPLVSAFREATS